MNQIVKRKNPSPSSIPMDHPQYPIFGRQYRCRVPLSSHFGTDYLEEYGIHGSGNKAVDLALFTKPTFCYLTINQQVELYHQCTCVGIIHQADTLLIYEACQNYTFDAAERIRKRLFNHDVPFNDLIKIDEYAEAVYQYAGHHYGKEFAKTFIGEGVAKAAEEYNSIFDSIDKARSAKKKETVDQNTIFGVYSTKRRGTEEKAKEMKEAEPLPPRPSVREMFENYMRGRPGS